MSIWIGSSERNYPPLRTVKLQVETRVSIPKINFLVAELNLKLIENKTKQNNITFQSCYLGLLNKVSISFLLHIVWLIEQPSKLGLFLLETCYCSQLYGYSIWFFVICSSRRPVVIFSAMWLPLLLLVIFLKQPKGLHQTFALKWKK